jgi:cytochrome P450
MTTSLPAERKYDLYSQALKDDPYPVFERMRQDDPVFSQPGIDGKTMIWFVSRYDDVQAMLHDEQRFVRDPGSLLPSSVTGLPTDLENLLNNHMLNKDGADHRRLRNLVSLAFTPGRVRALRPHIQAIADALLDPLVPRGAMDLVADYAFPLPTIVISHLLGVPAEDRQGFKRWSNALVAPALTPAEQARAAELLQDFVGYLQAFFAARRAEPRDDLISALLKAEEAGDQLTQGELYSTVVLLIVAGHETTVNLIGNAALVLLRDPVARARLQAHPEQMPAAVEEFLRYDSPVERALTRWVAQDTVLRGQSLKRGDVIIGLIGAANRDVAQFPNPDALDLDRRAPRHLSFGHGAHYCLGAPLARLEGEIALNTLLRRLPALQLAVPDPDLRWRLVPLFRGLTALPVAWDPAPATPVS